MARSPFTVERDLRVKIATKPKTKGEGTKVRPGDDIGGDDHHDRSAGQAGGGRIEPGDDRAVAPGAVRLAAALDRRLLPRRRAAPAVRCTSSITFSYRPATQPINPRLIAEKDREEIAKEEEESRRAMIAAASEAPAAVTFGGGDTLLTVRCQWRRRSRHARSVRWPEFSGRQLAINVGLRRRPVRRGWRLCRGRESVRGRSITEWTRERFLRSLLHAGRRWRRLWRRKGRSCRTTSRLGQ